MFRICVPNVPPMLLLRLGRSRRAGLVCGRRSRCASRRNNRRRLNTIELREILVQVSLPFVGDLALVARGCVRIATVEGLDYVHAGSHFAEWRKAHAIKAGIIAKIDE